MGYTGTPPTFLAGEVADADKYDEISDFMVAGADPRDIWVPTLSSITLGTGGTVTARWRQLGDIDYRIKIVLGTGGSLASNPSFTLPAAPHAGYAPLETIGDADLVDTSVATRPGRVVVSSGSTVEIVGLGTTGIVTGVTSSSPHAWGAGDKLICWGRYEPA